MTVRAEIFQAVQAGREVLGRSRPRVKTFTFRHVSFRSSSISIVIKSCDASVRGGGGGAEMRHGKAKFGSTLRILAKYSSSRTGTARFRRGQSVWRPTDKLVVAKQ